jgi:hypothetical protein
MTPRQAEVFAYIRDHIENTGRAPVLQAIADRFGFSKPRASIIVSEIVEQGALNRVHPGTHGLRLPGQFDLSPVATELLRAELARRGVTFDALEEPRLLRNEGRPCAANHCFERVKPGRLMCRDHWFQLPEAYRRDILRAWGARQMQAYQEALERARDFLGGYNSVVERMG